MTPASEVKRAVRPTDEEPVFRSVATVVADHREARAAQSEENQVELSQLEQLLQGAAPEDRLDVLWTNAAVLLPLYDEHKMTAEAIIAHVRDLVGRFDLWGTDRSNELEIEKITRGLSKLMAAEVTPVDDTSIEEPSMVDEVAGYETADEMPVDLPPLSLKEWQGRELKAPDFLLGSALSTTNRWLVTGPTGIGKTNFAIALGMSVAAGDGFLHWRGVRPGRVLYVDGEMSNRVVRQRFAAEVHRRSEVSPSGFYGLCAADVEDFAPLNSDRGRAFIWRVIEQIGDVDLVIFDNVMSLIAGGMAEEGPWAEVMPFVRSLTRRSIGQVWIHHTGHREDRSYGTKTREWQMDTVAILQPRERGDTDVSFTLSFSKARERAPSNRDEFREVEIALVNDQWTHRFAGEPAPKPASTNVTATNESFLAALSSIAKGNRVGDDVWKAECDRRGLIDLSQKPDAARSLFSRHKKALKGANLIGSEDGSSWVR